MIYQKGSYHYIIALIALQISIMNACSVSNCAACPNQNECQSCTSGFILVNSTYCINYQQNLNCPYGSAVDFEGCSVCTQGRGFIQSFNGTNITGCTPCSLKDCESCMGNYRQCQACYSGFIRYFVNSSITDFEYSNIQCLDLESNGFNCSTYQDFIGCTNKCGNGLYGPTGFRTNYKYGLTACSTCLADICGNCQTNYAYCASCPSNWFPDSIGQCWNGDTLGCTGLTNPRVGCSSCPASSFPILRHELGLTQCIQCPAFCETCSSLTYCDSCVPGYKLHIQPNNGSTCIPNPAMLLENNEFLSF